MARNAARKLYSTSTFRIIRVQRGIARPEGSKRQRVTGNRCPSYLEHETKRGAAPAWRAAKPNDRDGFPGKSDFLRAVNHSAVNRSLVGDVPLPPFVLFALPLRGARVLAQRFTIPTR